MIGICSLTDEEFKQKALEHYRRMEQANIILAEAIMWQPDKCPGIQDLIMPYKEPDKDVQTENSVTG